MITVITGAPGSGKSAALVSMLTELGKNRAIYVHNIPELQLEHVPLEDPTDWHNVVPDGAIVVIDEVQRVWRPRGPGQKVPDHIAMLETHRHRGLDFYLVTQYPKLVDANVRALTGRHVHLRDIGFLGRWWYEWPEIADNCAASWKQAPIKKRYRLPKKIFGQYKSASEHIKPVRSFPKVVFILAAALIATAVLAWQAFGTIAGKINPAGADPAKAAQKTPDNPLGLKTMGSSQQTAYDPAIGPIDDRVAFIPRVSNKPESAPAYDHLRVIVSMPVITGAVCMGQRCKCYTHQATDAGLSDRECAEWLKNRPFDPYRPNGADPAPAAPAPTAANPPPAPSHATPSAS